MLQDFLKWLFSEKKPPQPPKCKNCNSTLVEPYNFRTNKGKLMFELTNLCQVCQDTKGE